MTLPEQFQVTYTEEDAEYLTLRPVVKQTFRLHELVDMVLSVTGKDPARVRHILRIGTLVFNFYRYRWPGFETSDEELAAVLAQFPDADASRAFRAEDCAAALLVARTPATIHAARPDRIAAGAIPSNAVEVSRDTAAKRRMFSSRSFWDATLDLARSRGVNYGGYSYARRGDLYEVEISPQEAAALAEAARKFAPRVLRAQLMRAADAERILFLCPRK